MKISSIILLVGVCPRLLSMRASSLRSMAPEPSRSVSKKAVLACASSASERVERTAYAAAELFCDDRSMCVWADVCVCDCVCARACVNQAHLMFRGTGRDTLHTRIARYHSR